MSYLIILLITVILSAGVGFLAGVKHADKALALKYAAKDAAAKAKEALK